MAWFKATDVHVVAKIMYNTFQFKYRQFSNIRCTQSQNINISRLALLLPLPNPLKPCVKLRMKM